MPSDLPITWKEFKEKAEKAGVKDTDRVVYIEIQGDDPDITVVRPEYDYGPGLHITNIRPRKQEKGRRFES